jgi:hypothetical protein
MIKYQAGRHLKKVELAVPFESARRIMTYEKHENGWQRLWLHTTIHFQ